MLAATLAAGIFAGTSALSPPAPTAQAASNPIYWGAYVDQAPYYTAPLDQFESDAGKRESIVFWGEPWEINGSMQPFQTQEYEAVRQRGSIPLIGWTSLQLGYGNTQPNYTLAKIYEGAHDAYITKWAQDAKAWGHPFFMRFDHEMNGWWYPWSEQKNGNQPGDYVKAWRHVVDIFRSVGATNATWVWNVNMTSNVATPLPDLYPGDNYVDWTSMDGYNWGGTGWITFDQVFGLNPWSKRNTYEDILAVAPTKPMMVGETATSKNGGDPAAWIRDTLLTQIPTKYTAIKALLWFNWNAGNSALSWPIESSPAQQAAFRQAISSSYYATDTFGSLPAGAIQPIGGSAPPPPPPPTPVPAGPGTINVLSTADTYVDVSQPISTAAGSSIMLQSSTDTAGAAYLQFDLTALAGKTLTYVQLSLLSGANGSTIPHDVKYVSDTSWTEQSTSYNHSVPASAVGATLGVINAPAAYTWYAASLAISALQSHLGGKISLKIDSATPGMLPFSSRESGVENAPRLLIQYK